MDTKFSESKLFLTIYEDHIAQTIRVDLSPDNPNNEPIAELWGPLEKKEEIIARGRRLGASWNFCRFLPIEKVISIAGEGKEEKQQ